MAVLICTFLCVFFGAVTWLAVLWGARTSYEALHARVTDVGFSAARLGHEGQRYLIGSWRPEDQRTERWRVTMDHLSWKIPSVISDAERLSVSRYTETLIADLSRVWNMMVHRGNVANTAVDALIVSGLAADLSDRSVINVYHASLEYPHNRNVALIFYSGAVVRAFNDLALSSEALYAVLERLTIAIRTEASAIDQSVRVAAAIAALALVGAVGLFVARRLREPSRQPRPEHHAQSSGVLIPHDSGSAIMVETIASRERNDVPADLPHWLSYAIRTYKDSDCISDGVDQFVEYCGRSAEHVSRTVKAKFGITLTDYLNNERIARAARLLADSDETIATIAQSVGFRCESYFYRTFRAAYSMTPAQFRSRAAASRCSGGMHTATFEGQAVVSVSDHT